MSHGSCHDGRHTAYSCRFSTSFSDGPFILWSWLPHPAFANGRIPRLDHWASALTFRHAFCQQDFDYRQFDITPSQPYTAQQRGLLVPCTCTQAGIYTQIKFRHNTGSSKECQRRAMGCTHQTSILIAGWVHRCQHLGCTSACPPTSSQQCAS